MKTLFLFIASFFLISATCRNEQGRWVIESSSRLIIYGSTNINNFKCSLDYYNSNDTLEYNISEESCNLFFSRNQMLVPVRDFGCGNEMITKDFLGALQAEQYPYIRIYFLSLLSDQPLPGSGAVKGKVAITLAGVTKQYTLAYSIQRSSAEIIQLKGTQAVCFSDFNLKTPQKMMGLIQVQEDLRVEFHLSLRSI